jgi:hypothetical protein
MKIAIDDKAFVFRGPDFGSRGQGLSGLWRCPATRAALMLNLRPVRLGWRESLSLRRFQNTTYWKMH